MTIRAEEVARGGWRARSFKGLGIYIESKKRMESAKGGGKLRPYEPTDVYCADLTWSVGAELASALLPTRLNQRR